MRSAAYGSDGVGGEGNDGEGGKQRERGLEGQREGSWNSLSLHPRLKRDPGRHLDFLLFVLPFVKSQWASIADIPRSQAESPWVTGETILLGGKALLLV
jgi:hypothetical protein